MATRGKSINLYLMNPSLPKSSARRLLGSLTLNGFARTVPKAPSFSMVKGFSSAELVFSPSKAESIPTASKGNTGMWLIWYTKLSPNHSGQRTHSIDRITPHCVVGQCSVETLGNIMYPTSRQASCNYGSEEVNRKANYSCTCAFCGKQFTSYGNKHRKYCSHACYINDRFGGGC